MEKKNGVEKAINKTEKAVVNTKTYLFRNHNRSFRQKAADN